MEITNTYKDMLRLMEERQTPTNSGIIRLVKDIFELFNNITLKIYDWHITNNHVTIYFISDKSKLTMDFIGYTGDENIKIGYSFYGVNFLNRKCEITSLFYITQKAYKYSGHRDAIESCFKYFVEKVKSDECDVCQDNSGKNYVIDGDFYRLCPECLDMVFHKILDHPRGITLTQDDIADYIYLAKSYLNEDKE